MRNKEWFMDLQEAVMSMRKAAYEFGCSDNPEDHELMLKYQRAIFDIVEANTSAPTIPAGWRILISEAIATLESHGDHVSLCADLRAMIAAAPKPKEPDGWQPNTRWAYRDDRRCMTLRWGTP